MSRILAPSVSVIDTASNMVTATVAVGAHPIGVAVAPDGKHAYVANANSNTVSVIRTATNTVVATVPVGNAPDAVAVTPDGKHAYVASDLSASETIRQVTAISPLYIRNPKTPFGLEPYTLVSGVTLHLFGSC
jgi:YVTN family beta-propeller protein